MKKNNNGEWADEFGVIYSADRRKRIEATEPLKVNFQIEDECQVICDNAFRFCKQLVAVSISSSVTSIENYAFYGGSNLTTIYIPKGSKNRFEKLLSDRINHLIKI